jgi:hypothetical protein
MSRRGAPDKILHLAQYSAGMPDRRPAAQDESTPFFSTPHFARHPSVLVRASRLGELSLAELQDASALVRGTYGNR